MLGVGGNQKENTKNANNISKIDFFSPYFFLNYLTHNYFNI